MHRRASAFADLTAPPELRPVEVTRWSARLADQSCEQAFLESRFRDGRRRVLVLLGFIVCAGALIACGRGIAVVTGHGALTGILPPLVPVVVASCGAFVLLRARSPQAIEMGLLAIGTVAAATRFIMLTLQPAMSDSWLPLMVTSLFIIYVYLPVRLPAATAFAAFYSALWVGWWVSLYGAPLGAEQIYFGILWVMLANGLGFAAANTLQRSQRVQFAQSLILQQLLSTDALTGIGNRRRFDEAFDREWRRCGRAGAPLSLLMIDVDHFKAYNDQCGHQQGDECLREIARILTGRVNRPGDLVARYGGEEFVCLLPEIGQYGARAVAMRLVAAVRRAGIPHPGSPLGARVTVSIGVATATDFAGERDALIGLADKQLYAAKHAGRNRIAAGEIAPAPVVPVAARVAA